MLRSGTRSAASRSPSWAGESRFDVRAGPPGVSQHASLSPERWAAFPRDRQLLMVANEMNRCQKLFAPDDAGRLTGGLERVLRLLDLTVEVNAAPGLRRELLRLRDLVAAQYVAEERSLPDFRAAFRALLLLTPETARQIPFVLPA